VELVQRRAVRIGRTAPAQIIGIIKEQKAGLATVEVWRKHGLGTAIFYNLKVKYGG